MSKGQLKGMRDNVIHDIRSSSNVIVKAHVILTVKYIFLANPETFVKC